MILLCKFQKDFLSLSVYLVYFFPNDSLIGRGCRPSALLCDIMSLWKFPNTGRFQPLRWLRGASDNHAWAAGCLCLDLQHIYKRSRRGWRRSSRVSHVVAFFLCGKTRCVQPNEVGKRSVFSINSNHKAIEAWKMNLFLPMPSSFNNTRTYAHTYTHTRAQTY